MQITGHRPRHPCAKRRYAVCLPDGRAAGSNLSLPPAGAEVRRAHVGNAFAGRHSGPRQSRYDPPHGGRTGDSSCLLDGCADAYNPKTVRASMGAVFRTQPVSMTRTQAIAGCREQGIPLLATAMSADAVDLRQADLRAAAVVIGSEGQGICPELFAAAEQKIIIPMSPRCESLNAAVAATIVLWQMKR